MPSCKIAASRAVSPESGYFRRIASCCLLLAVLTTGLKKRNLPRGTIVLVLSFKVLRTQTRKFLLANQSAMDFNEQMAYAIAASIKSAKTEEQHRTISLSQTYIKPRSAISRKGHHPMPAIKGGDILELFYSVIFENFLNPNTVLAVSTGSALFVYTISTSHNIHAQTSDRLIRSTSFTVCFTSWLNITKRRILFVATLAWLRHLCYSRW